MKKIFFLLTSFGSIVFLASFVLQDNQWTAPKEDSNKVNPIESNEKSLKLGKKIYSKMCWNCHGVDGKGNGPAGISLEPKPANFTIDRLQAQKDGELYWKITTGKGTMASYKNSLTNDQRWSLVNYIRTLKK